MKTLEEVREILKARLKIITDDAADEYEAQHPHTVIRILNIDMNITEEKRIVN